ncbi:hypothetical protein BDN72DRAFT_625806 [Pluteus cervinus]|uniref:Uncharacterized protein n=1 Tax=Pluteus cervinus TaxID=181527 RepID=A0ACD3A1F8_9AGAR|nr:hypothetical protein BDN72DRAFT_625806 [Pluteus cervinus]
MRKGFLNEETHRRSGGALPTSKVIPSPRPQASDTSERPTRVHSTSASTKANFANLNLPCTPLRPDPPNEVITLWGEGQAILPFPQRNSSGRIVGPADLLCGILSYFPEFPNPNLVTPERRYRIGSSSIPNAGLGVFATEDLGLGDILMVDEPFLAGPLRLQTPERLTAEGQRDHDYVLRETIEDMPESYQRIFWSLHNAKPALAKSDVGGILCSNGLEITLRPGDPQYVGLGKDIVRINHSCTPNAVYGWSLHDWCWTVYAVTPIKKGEEVFISYTTNTLPRRYHLEELQTKYGMNPCRCPSCSQISEREIGISDANKHKIISFLPPRWYMDGDYTGKHDPDLNEAIRRPGPNKENLRRLLKKSQDWMDLVQKERCWEIQIVGLHGRRLVKGYLALGDEAREKVHDVIKMIRVLEILWKMKEPGWTEVLARMDETRWWNAAVTKTL